MSTPDYSLLDRIATTCGELCGAIAQLDATLARAAEPPLREQIQLTPDKSRDPGRCSKTALSYGIKNHGNVSVWAGIEGQQPRAGTGAIEVPPGAHFVIPARCQDVPIGIDPGDVGDITDGVVFVDTYRYWTVQPAAEFVLTTAVTSSGDLDGGTP